MLVHHKLELDREKLSFTLTGMTGSMQMEIRLVDLIVMSMDESVVVESPNVKRVAQMPISASCIPWKEDVVHWPCLKGIDIPAIRDGEVLLFLGLSKNLAFSSH